MRHFARFRAWLEFIGGVTDTAPFGFPHRWAAWLTAAWWATLAALIALFCGQTSKFIYIDF
jgi:hypothetical protein